MTESEDTARRPARWNPLAWLLILVSLFLMLWLTPRLTPIESSEIEDEASALAILKIQSRVVMGLEQLTPEAAESEAADLDLLAISPQTTAAVAGLKLLRNSDENGKEQAIELLDRELELEDSTMSASARRLLTDLKSIVEGVSGVAILDEYEISPYYFDYYRLASLPEDDPARVEFRKRSLQTAVGYVGGIVAVLGLAFLGLILLLVALARQSNGKRLFLFEERLPLDGVLLTGFALYLFIMAAGQVLSVLVANAGEIDAFPTDVAYAVSGALGVGAMVASVIIGFLYPRWRGMDFAVYRRRMGWHRGQGFFKEAFNGLTGYIAMLPIFLIGVVGTILLGLILNFFAAEDAAAEPVSHPIVSQLAEGGIAIKIGMFLLAAVMAPLFEETMFRGALYRSLRGKWNFLASGLMSGFIFAIIHPQGIIAVPALMAMGFGFAMIREWRDSLIAPMVAHAVHNGTLVTAMLFAFG